MTRPAATVTRPMRGTARVPGDKSISHRAAILAALAPGSSVIRGFSPAGDCRATLDVLRALGVRISADGTAVMVEGRALRPPVGPLDCRRSGTTIRLMAGVLAAASFRSTLTGHEQLLRRPMERVASPLKLMGAEVRTSGGSPPLEIEPRSLHGVDHELPVASAQVKSALLLAGLFADGPTSVIESVPTRDHTERLLEWLGLRVERKPGRVTVRPGHPERFELDVPGDVSSAAPLLAAASIVPGSDVAVDGVGLNPTRTGFLDVLRRMGADLEAVPTGNDGPEPSGLIRVRHTDITATTIQAAEVPMVVDELPLIGVLATQAQGETVVRGAGELRLKESDRIAGLVEGLRSLGADAEELPDGFVVRGPTPLRAAPCDSRSDHRLAMAFTVAGLVAAGPVTVSGMGFVPDSFPGFERTLEALR